MLGVLALTLAGCGVEREQRTSAPAAPDRIAARPGPGGGECAPGEHALPGSARMRVTPDGGERKALIVALHGAGQRPRDALFVFRAAWDEPGIVVVAPASAGPTWARWRDVAGIDRALRAAFARCPVDPERVAVGGFSDGATYALSLAVANGDLFEAAIALSPGGVVSESVVGRPRFFLAHGTRDSIIPIERGSALIVPVLRDFGYPVTYRTFEGGHEVPPLVSAAAVDWFLRG